MNSVLNLINTTSDVCNRCAEANRIEAIVNGEAKPASGPQRKNHNGKPGFDGWSKTQLLAEAIRLRGVQKSRFYSPDVD